MSKYLRNGHLIPVLSINPEYDFIRRKGGNKIQPEDIESGRMFPYQRLGTGNTKNGSDRGKQGELNGKVNFLIFSVKAFPS